MKRVFGLLVVGFLGLVMLASSGQSGEKEKKIKGMLPPGWKKLNLSADQVQKIYGVQNEYKGKIQELKKKIQDLENEERSEMVKVLTDEQKKLLQKLTLGEDPKKKPAEKP